MIGEQFKGTWDGEARTQFQPIKTDEKFPPAVSYGYLRHVPGHKHPWMAYCRYRHDWLLRVLAANGVDVRQFQPPSKKVTKGKCREIARVLERIRKEKPGSIGEPALMAHDINFWATAAASASIIGETRVNFIADRVLFLHWGRDSDSHRIRVQRFTGRNAPEH